MVAEVGLAPEDNHIFRIAYDGTLYEERRFAAIGGQEAALEAALEAHYADGADLATVLGWGKDAFQQVAERAFAPTEWEAAVVDRTLGRRTFRRLADDELG